MRKIPTLFLFILCICSVSLWGQSGIKSGPYLQNVSDNEVTVVWLTQTPSVSWVEIAPEDEENFYARKRQRFYDSPDGLKKIGCLHNVRITGLTPGTVYRYRIYSREVTELEDNNVLYGATHASLIYQIEPYRFRTTDSKNEESVDLLILNDIHEDDKKLRQLLDAGGHEKADLIIYNGDMVTRMSSEELLCEKVIDPSSDIFAKEKPFIYVRGNHETRGLLSGRFTDYFPTPTGKPYFTFRRGPAYFIVLDAGEDKPDSDIEYHSLADFDPYRQKQAEWLKDVVAQEEFRQSPVRIVLIHIPPVASTWYGPLWVKETIVPILNNAGIDLMVSGHIHKHFYIPSAQDTCLFPVLINSNEEAVRLHADPKGIRFNVVDRKGKVILEDLIPANGR